jgi:alpha-tubulin suppressor-like RCC1 family protein
MAICISDIGFFSLALWRRQEWVQPQRVKGLEDVEIMDVAGSGVISMALAKDGSVWSWGSSKRGQLGLARDVIRSETPQQVKALAGCQVSKVLSVIPLSRLLCL